MVLGKLPVPGRPTNLDSSRARAYCACCRCGWGLFGLFLLSVVSLFFLPLGWSGGAKVLGKPPVPGRPTIWMIVGQGPTVLAVGAGWVVWTFLLSTIFYPLFPSLSEAARYRLRYCLKGSLNPNNQPTNFSPSLWETARYRLKYCLKRPLSPKQPTNQLYLKCKFCRESSNKRQGPTALAVGAGGRCFDIFTLDYPFCPLSPSLGDGPI